MSQAEVDGFEASGFFLATGVTDVSCSEVAIPHNSHFLYLRMVLHLVLLMFVLFTRILFLLKCSLMGIGSQSIEVGSYFDLWQSHQQIIF